MAKQTWAAGRIRVEKERLRGRGLICTKSVMIEKSASPVYP
jgi:hypothetical protein